jgi:hypothetical protein
VTDIIVDGTVCVSIVPTIANPAAPTLAELAAGFRVQNILTMAGLIGYKADTAAVPNTSLASKFGTSLPGRASYSNPALEAKKQQGTDTLYNTAVRNAAFNVVIRRFMDEATAYAAGQACEVYPVTCGETAHIDPEENTVARYQVPTFFSSSPTTRAIIAA